MRRIKTFNGSLPCQPGHADPKRTAGTLSPQSDALKVPYHMRRVGAQRRSRRAKPSGPPWRRSELQRSGGLIAGCSEAERPSHSPNRLVTRAHVEVMTIRLQRGRPKPRQALPIEIDRRLTTLGVLQ